MHFIINSANENYILNAALYHQSCITSSTLHYIFMDTLQHQQFILSSTLHYSANNKFHHQCCITSSSLHYIVNAVLQHQQCTTALTVHYSANDELHYQRCINLSILPRLRHTVNLALKIEKMPHWTLSRNAESYVHFFPTTNTTYASPCGKFIELKINLRKKKLNRDESRLQLFLCQFYQYWLRYQSSSEGNGNRSILKDDLSSKTETSIFTAIAWVIRRFK